MAKIFGDNDGIKLLKKLRDSQDPIVKEYFNRLWENTKTSQCIYFSDMEEQKKKKLNNQTTYKLFYDFEKQNWEVELFMVPRS